MRPGHGVTSQSSLLHHLIKLVIPQISSLNKGNNIVSLYCFFFFLDQFSRQSYLDLLPAELKSPQGLCE